MNCSEGKFYPGGPRIMTTQPILPSACGNLQLATLCCQESTGEVWGPSSWWYVRPYTSPFSRFRASSYTNPRLMINPPETAGSSEPNLFDGEELCRLQINPNCRKLKRGGRCCKLGIATGRLYSRGAHRMLHLTSRKNGPRSPNVAFGK